MEEPLETLPRDAGIPGVFPMWVVGCGEVAQGMA